VKLITKVAKPLRAPGRRNSDIWPMVTRILKDVLVITGAIVSVIYSYGIGQQSNVPSIASHEALKQVESARQVRETEEKIKAMNEQLLELKKGTEAR
jgi:hypothetical protein